MQKKLSILAIVLVLLATYAYSALSTSLTFVGDAAFRAVSDIRVTDTTFESAGSGASVQYESTYKKDTITNGFVLPNENSSITYKVTITNSGLVDESIYNIINQSSNNNGLTYVLKDSYNNELTLPYIIGYRESKDIYITYTTTSPSDNVINVINKFDFRALHYVTYNLKGGSSTETDLVNGQIKYENVNLTLTSAEPTRQGYSFLGWTDEQNGTVVKFSPGDTYTLDQDKILYAVWELNIFNITLNNESATTSGTETIYVQYNDGYYLTNTDGTLSDKITTTTNGITVPVKDGYSFGGYYTDNTNYTTQYIDETGKLTSNASNTFFTGNGNLYAKWTPYTLTINYYAGGAQKNGNTTLTEQLLSTVIKNYNDTSYAASGLDNYNDGTWHLTKTGYTATKYWHVGSANNSTKIHEDTTYATTQALADTIGKLNEFKVGNISINVYAGWQVKTYTLTIDATTNGGTYTGDTTRTMTYDASDNNDIGIASKTGYTFTGWNTESDGTGTALYDNEGKNRNESNYWSTVYPSGTWQYDNNETVYAQFIINTYTITFNKNNNNATGTMGSQTLSYMQSENIDANAFSLSGYRFVGWNTEANGSGTAYLDGDSITLTSNITLYAQWIENTYIVTFNSNDGSFENNETTNTVVYSPTEGEVTKISHTSNVNDEGTRTGYMPQATTGILDKVKIIGASSVNVSITYQTYNASNSWVAVYNGNVTPTTSNYSQSVSNRLYGTTQTTRSYTISGDTVQFLFYNSRAQTHSNSNYYGYYATITGTGRILDTTSGTYAEPTKDNYLFVGWNTEEDGSGIMYEDEYSLSSITNSVTLYAQFRRPTSTLITGQEFNQAIKRLTGTTSASYSTNNTTITDFTKYTGEVTDEFLSSKTVISTTDSETKTYAWYENGTIYYYANADTIYFNPNSNYMFYYLSKLATLDLSDFDLSKVTSISSIFDYANNLGEITTPQAYPSSATISLPISMIDTNTDIVYSDLSKTSPTLTTLHSVSTFLPGMEFNQAIKRLTGTTSATYSTNNTTITNFTKYTGEVTEGFLDDKTIVSTSGSYMPIYAWFDNGTIYYYSQSDTIYFNPDCSYMFYYLNGLTYLDLSEFNLGKIINSSSMMSGMNAFFEIITPNIYSTRTSIPLPKTMYNTSNTAYSSLSSSSPKATSLKIGYTITFNTSYYDANNGTQGVNSTKVVRAGNPIGTLPTITITRVGYDKGGIYTDTTYTEEVTSETIPSSNTTYYLKWVKTGVWSSDVFYDNTSTGLNCTTAQCALDYLSRYK